MNVEDVAALDKLCCVLYSGASNDERKAAETKLAMLSDINCLTKTLAFAEHSTSTPSLFVVCACLRRILGTQWEHLSSMQLLGLSECVLQLLANKGPALDQQVISSLAVLLAQATKLGWSLDVAHRKLPGRVHALFFGASSSMAHRSIGLASYQQLVEEVGHLKTKRSLQDHKETLASFRDSVLSDLFRVGLEHLSLAKEQAQVQRTAISIVVTLLAHMM